MARLKKPCVVLLLAAALALQLGTSALATRAVENATVSYRGIHIAVNGTQIHPCDAAGKAVEPFILEGTTYLPVRAVADALGLTVGWNAATSTVTLNPGGQVNYGGAAAVATNGTKTLPLVYRDIRLVIDGVAVHPTDANGDPAEPFIIDGATYLPVRAVAGALGLTVGWDDASSTVTLDEPASDESEFLLTKETEEIRTGEGFATKTYKTMKTYRYDSSGKRVEMTLYSPDGNVVTRYSYDQQGRPLREASSEKNTFIAYTYSQSGMLLSEKRSSDDGTVELAYTYDTANRLTRCAETHKRPDGTLLDDGVTTTYRYDSKGQLLETVSSWRGRSDSELLEYDDYGNIVKRTTRENFQAETWLYTYDKHKHLLTERSIDGKQQRSYNYDSDGNMTSCVYVHEAGIDSTICTYKDDRMVTKSYAGADGSWENWTWTYDGAGVLLAESYGSSAGGSYTITHVRSDDGRQLRIDKLYADGGAESDVTTYDEYGNIIAREIDGPGRWARYTYEYTKP